MAKLVFWFQAATPRNCTGANIFGKIKRFEQSKSSGIKSSTSKPPKVSSIKGKRQVGIIYSAERGQIGLSYAVECSWNFCSAYFHICSQRYVGTSVR